MISTWLWVTFFSTISNKWNSFSRFKTDRLCGDQTAITIYKKTSGHLGQWNNMCWFRFVVFFHTHRVRGEPNTFLLLIMFSFEIGDYSFKTNAPFDNSFIYSNLYENKNIYFFILMITYINFVLKINFIMNIRIYTFLF